MRAVTLCNSIALLVLVLQATFTAAQPSLYCSYCNDTKGNYTTSSSYGRNLRSLLSKILSNTQIENGFYKFSVGQDPDRVNGMAVCRADLSLADCKSCLRDATESLPEICPIQKEALGYYYGRCMLRYSGDQVIFRFGENSPGCQEFHYPFNIQIPDLRKRNQSMGILFQQLKHIASTGNSSYKFSSGAEQVTDDLHFYGVAQCNPDLSTLECSNCLQDVSTSLQQCCSDRSGSEFYGPFCGLQFANYPILTVVSNASSQSILPLSPSAAAKSGKRNKTWIIVILVVAFLLIAAGAMFGLSRRTTTKNYNQEGNGHFKLVDSLELDFSTIQFATDYFSDDKRLGGSSGATSMYKGVLPDGQEIAVKRLNKGGREGKKEFDHEALLSANFQHKNLLKFLGFCTQKDTRVLVYEFLPNGSLDDTLCDPVKRASLDWPTRYHIISGLARGLLYLHEDSQVRVIHRDLKPSNILLDVQMDPKISNFRTASLARADQTKVDSTVAGTYEYMPIEYVEHGHSSMKSDIFSFGVILLEIISGSIISRFSDGRNEENLLTYAWRKWREGSVLDVVDQTLSDIEEHTNQIQRCVKIALLCVEEDPRQRPAMSTVVFMLNSDTVDIAEPIRPAPLILSETGLHSVSHSHSTQSYSSHEISLNEASISTLDPR